MRYLRPPVPTADRSLPRKSIVMRICPDAINRIPEPVLPEGYSFRLYRDGDAADWARIALSVREALTFEEGLRAIKGFMDKEEELKRRLVFAIAPDGTAAATSMAWAFEEEGRRFGRVHWIMTEPAHQGRGLGRAVVAWAIRRISETEPGLDAYLDTQTWSHKAIGLYLRMGFRPCRESHPVLRGVNEYTAAAEILKNGILPPESCEMFLNEAVD